MTSPTASPTNELTEVYSFGAFRLDVGARELLQDGQPVALTAKVFDTLLVLLRHRGRVVEKDELIKLVWPDAFVSDDSLTHSISVLRRTLGDDSSQPQFIATIPRRGYRFVESVVGEHPSVTVKSGADSPAGFAAGEATTPSSGARRPYVGSDSTRGRALWLRFALGGVVAAALLILTVSTPTVSTGIAPAGPVRFIQPAPENHAIASGAVLSPDGKHLAFVATEEGTGRPELWVRALDGPESRVLPATEGAYRPFWSPDSRSIGFFADGKLKRIDLDDKLPQALASVGYRPSGGSWSPSGTILFANRQSELFSVSAIGGEPRPVTALDKATGQIAHLAPYFLPDGRHFLFHVMSTKPEARGTWIGSLESGEHTKLLDGSSAAIHALPGYLLHIRDGMLVAQRFDESRLRVTGTPVTIAATQSSSAPDIQTAVISASTTGLLTFGGDTPTSHLVWYSRKGAPLATITTPTNLRNPAMSPDQRYIAAEGGGDRGGIWILDVERGASTRLTDGLLPLWTSNGTELVYTFRPPGGGGASDLWRRPVSGPQEQHTVVVHDPEMKIGGNWTRNGRYLVYASSNAETRLDLWMHTEGDPTPRPYLRTPFNEMHPQVSPDGRWIAYASDESGRWEVYVQSFPETGAKQTVSIGGGAEPQWRGDGRELYYLAPDGSVMAVSVTDAAVLKVARPVALFRAPISADIITYRNQYAATADGQRFIVDTAAEREPINVVVNWTALLNP